jgi:hypothetical protein
LRHERGAALLVVLVALAALLPIVVALSELVLARQRQANTLRENLSGEAAARGGLEVALARLSSRQITLDPGQDLRFELDGPPGRVVAVRVQRDPDAVLLSVGAVLRADEVAESPDGMATAAGQGQLIGEHRRLEVYLVEVECASHRPFPSVRVLAAAVRVGNAAVEPVGVRSDRGYWPAAR